MSRLLLTAAVLAVLVYTMVLGVRWLSPRIEQDIAGRVTTGLAEQGLLWADVAVQGRDVVLSGEAPDTDSKDKAVSVATRVFGVSKVMDELTVADEASSAEAVKAKQPKTVKAPADYALTIVKDGETISFEGNVADEASKKVLIDLAANRYGIENVDGTKLTVVEGAPAGWRSAVGAVLMHISNMENANVVVNGTEVMISGTVIDKGFSDKMEADVSQVLPKEYKAAFAVDVVTPTVTDIEPAAGEDAVACDMSAAEKEVLLFGFDKAQITAEHTTQLKVVEDVMAACADAKMVVAGYTDVTGSALYNRWLSLQRAEAAQRRLMREGVAKERLHAVGYGELYPVADNTTRDGRAKNRRVEFHAGDALPHAEGVVENKAAKATPVAKVEVDANNVSTETMVQVEPAAGPAEQPTPANKPWWASKTVSETAVEVK